MDRHCNGNPLPANGCIRTRQGSGRRRLHLSKISLFVGLPITVQQIIAHFLLPNVVYSPEELAQLVEIYPLEYMSVELAKPLSQTSVNYFGKCKNEVSSLKEIVICGKFDEWREVISSALGMPLESCSLRATSMKRRDAQLLLSWCKTSKNKSHVFELVFDSMSKRDADITFLHLADLIKCDKSLVYLDLRGIQLRRAGVRILEELNTTGTLAFLQLYELEMPSHLATSLGQVLERQRTLFFLELGWNDIGDDGVAAIASALKTNITLMFLSLRHVKATGNGIVKLANSLCLNEALRGLLLEDDTLGVIGGVALAQMLRSNRTLKRLCVNYCEMGVEGCHSIVNAVLESNSTLEVLRIGYCGLSDQDEGRLLSNTDRFRFLQVRDRNEVPVHNSSKLSPYSRLRHSKYEMPYLLLRQSFADIYRCYLHTRTIHLSQSRHSSWSN